MEINSLMHTALRIYNIFLQNSSLQEDGLMEQTIFINFKMKTKKMSLANIQGKLSRAEMKNIMAGSGGEGTCNCNSADDCTTWNEQCLNSCGGKLGDNYQGKCGCNS